MKQIITGMLLLIATTAFSQEFDGIKIEGSKSTFIKAMSDKGYSVKEDKGNIVTFNGNSTHKSLEILAVMTPTSQLVWKLDIFLPKETSWYSIKAQYNNYLSTLTEKYGSPDKTYGFFSDPYVEGDGYEMTALSVEKCTYMALWNSSGLLLAISKYSQVEISYENLTNSDLDTKEKNQADKQTF